MKKLVTGLLLVFAITSQAQEYKYTVKGNANETWVEINQLTADLIIEGTSGTEIKIVATDYEGLPEKAKGLKPLSAAGVDNTGIGLSVNQDGTKITIVGSSRDSDDAQYVIYLPKALNLKVDYGSWQSGDLHIKGMAGQVEAKAFSNDLVLENVTGPIVANTLSSDLIVKFTTLVQSAPSSLSSTSGDIEVSMPTTTKGVFKMSSMSGGVYTDLNFEMKDGQSDVRRIGGSSSTGKLNGGGVEVSLRSISGDIFIRKTN
jgi:lia operon protein LiaG